MNLADATQSTFSIFRQADAGSGGTAPWHRLLSALLIALTGLLSLLAFAAPFLVPVLAPGVAADAAARPDAPLITGVLVLLALAILLVELQGQAMSTKTLAALGVLVAMTAVLRFVEVAIPGPGGVSPIFVPVILAGYVFGARFGFLLGSLGLFVSAVITGGVGPWLPYQMIVTGWVGLTAGWLPHPRGARAQLLLLTLFGVFWGLFFGMLLNLYFWPLLMDGSGATWQPGLSWRANAGRYAAFYLGTSFVWDVGRAAGNALLMLAIGAPAVRALQRFRRRFAFAHEQ